MPFKGGVARGRVRAVKSSGILSRVFWRRRPLSCGLTAGDFSVRRFVTTPSYPLPLQTLAFPSSRSFSWRPRIKFFCLSHVVSLLLAFCIYLLERTTSCFILKWNSPLASGHLPFPAWILLPDVFPDTSVVFFFHLNVLFLVLQFVLCKEFC